MDEARGRHCKKHNVVVGHPHVEQGNVERVVSEGYRFLMCAPVQSYSHLEAARKHTDGVSDFPPPFTGEVASGSEPVGASGGSHGASQPPPPCFAMVPLPRFAGEDSQTPSPPFSSMKRAISSTPAPARRLVKKNGRAPRMRFDSRSMVSNEAPT